MLRKEIKGEHVVADDAVDQRDQSEREAENQPCKRAEHDGAQNDGHERERKVHGADLDIAAEDLQYDDERQQDRQKGDVAGCEKSLLFHDDLHQISRNGNICEKK